MIINYQNNAGNFYAKNPGVDAKRRLTFNNNGCTHFLIVSGSIGDEMDIRKNGILDRIAEIPALQDNNEELNKEKYKVRLIQQPSYIACGNCVQMEQGYSSHAVYGCKYDKANNKLNIYIPENDYEYVIDIPFTVKYSIRQHKSEAKSGFLGFCKKSAEFTGTYILHIDDVQDYQDGYIYYKLKDYDYFITKEMLGKNIYIKTGKNAPEPVLLSKSRSISIRKYC